MASQTCIKCGANDWSYFASGRRCRPCHLRYKSEWGKRTERNKGPRKAADHRKHLYGISEDDYQALVSKQNGCCAACGREAKLTVDHDHTTGKIRGLLCSQCNVAAGMLGDSYLLVQRLSDYLRKEKP